jgi:hypothetical protein
MFKDHLAVLPNPTKFLPLTGALALHCAAALVAMLLLINSGASAGVQSATGFSAAAPDLVFVQAPVISSSSVDRFPEGSRLVRVATGSRQATVQNLTPGLFAAADPQVSFDGAKVLFAARKEQNSGWQIWEMQADGSSKHQVTHCDSDCVRPAYLPRGEFTYTSIDHHNPDSKSIVNVANIDGSGAHPITFGPGNFQVETVLADGRILLTADAPLSPGPASGSTRELYTIRPDGTALMSFRCDHRQGVVRREAAELNDGTVVFVKSPAGSNTGELATIRRGSVHNASVSPSAQALLNPRPLGAERLAISKSQPGAVASKFDLYSFDLASRRFTAMFSDTKLSSLDAMPLSARTQPRWYWSTLNPQLKTGYFVCLNSRLTADLAGGRFPSSPVKVRVLSLDASGSEQLLGEAPVEKDGSFYIAVPPDRPVRFELIDVAGKVLHSQRSWVWARSGEEHGCVGCHEDKALAPENAWPDALRSFDTPTRLGLGSKTQ